VSTLVSSSCGVAVGGVGIFLPYVAKALAAAAGEKVRSTFAVSLHFLYPPNLTGSSPPWVSKKRKPSARSARARRAMAWAMSRSRARTFTGMHSMSVCAKAGAETNGRRSAKKVKVLKRLTDGKATRNAKGDITQSASYQSREAPVARVEPNRKWFNNTRVISQDALESFRSAVQAQASNPHTYLMKRNKLPMSLIEEKGNINGLKEHAAKIAVESQPFKDTFGPKAQRKRPKLDFSSIEDLAGRTGTMHETYIDRLEHAKLLSGTSGDVEADDNNPDGDFAQAREFIFMKGTSKRIWNELYKVIDSSDVILHVLDARDPDGTRCRSVEKYIRTEAPHKHLVFVLNKVDLVPSKVAVSHTPPPVLCLHPL
jgi:hypothetical protein